LAGDSFIAPASRSSSLRGKFPIQQVDISSVYLAAMVTVKPGEMVVNHGPKWGINRQKWEGLELDYDS
jgi:hypothetical protein